MNAPTDPRRYEEALFWRAVERELRGRGWSRKRAVAYVAQLKQGGAAESLHNEILGPTPRPAGLLARLLRRLRA